MVLRPQVITTRNILTSLVAPTGSRNAAMMGTAIWGPINEVVIIQNITDFSNIFGNDKTGTGVTGIKAADLFFNNGGTLKFVRLDDGDAAKSDYMGLNGATDVILFEGYYKGTYGENITIEVITNGSNRDVQITDGKILELHNNNGVGHATNESAAAEINANSSLVVATVQSGQETINLLDAISQTQLTGGDDGEDSLIDSTFTTAFDDLLLTEDYNFLLVPGETGDAFHSIMKGRIVTRATSEKKYSRYITGIDIDESIATAIARTSAGKRISVLAPSVKYTHRIDGDALNLDGSYLACAYAGLLCQLDVQNSGTHKTLTVEGVIVNTTTGKEYYSKAEQEQLLSGRINPIALVNNVIQSVRGITRNPDTTNMEFDGYIVDILDDIQTSSEEYLNSVIGKENSVESRAIQSARLDALLTTKKSEGIIEDFQPSTVSEASSPDTINAAVNPKPTKNTNFVRLAINAN